MPVPLLLFSDAVSASSGLARITRDLATRIAVHMLDVFRVATIGYGGAGSMRLPFPQYSWTYNPDWIIHDLPEVWEDFAGNNRGIFFTIQDASRMLWLARPQACSDERVRNFLDKIPFLKWGYFPVDACGPNGKFSVMLRECMLGYNRILNYSTWAENICRQTLTGEDAEKRDVDYLPHGIDLSVFYPRDRQNAREKFGEMVAVDKPIAIEDDELLVGIVATNQARKDFALGIAAVAEVARRRKVRLWIHTDVLDRHWSIPYLLADYGLQGAVVTLQNFSDDTMAQLYSACDVTLGIGSGEGFGYPIFESLACGCPCIHGNYGGAPEYMPKHLLVSPIGWRHEGTYACRRPVFLVSDWVKKVEAAVRCKERAQINPELGWSSLWPKWEAWFRKGVAQ